MFKNFSERGRFLCKYDFQFSVEAKQKQVQSLTMRTQIANSMLFWAVMLRLVRIDKVLVPVELKSKDICTLACLDPPIRLEKFTELLEIGQVRQQRVPEWRPYFLSFRSFL